MNLKTILLIFLQDFVKKILFYCERKYIMQYHASFKGLVHPKHEIYSCFLLEFMHISPNEPTAFSIMGGISCLEGST